MKYPKITITINVVILFFLWAIVAILLLGKTSLGLLYLFAAIPVSVFCYNSIKQVVLEQAYQKINQDANRFFGSYINTRYTIPKDFIFPNNEHKPNLTLNILCDLSLLAFVWTYFILFSSSKEFYIFIVIAISLLTIPDIINNYKMIKYSRAQKQKELHEQQKEPT